MNRWLSIFGHRLRLERRGLQLHVLFDSPTESADRGAPVEPPGPSSRALQGLDESRVELMRRQLRALLKRHPQSRAVLRHLAYLEGALRRDGARALDEAPVDVLKAALQQLEGLVTNWQQVGLAELRSRLAVAVIDRDAEARPPQLDAGARSDLLDTRRVHVTEASASDFAVAQARWVEPAAEKGAPAAPPVG